MPRLKTYEVEGSVTFNFNMDLDATSEKQALERARWFVENCMRIDWRKVKFPRSKKKQDVWFEDTDLHVRVDYAEEQQ